MFSAIYNFFAISFQIKKLPYAHNCASTAGLENNCMATNSWVRDRVINKLRQEPTLGATALKKFLEEKYKINISYYVVWDGRQMALDEILGKWEDSFDAAYNFKAELERTSPGSIVEVDHVTVDGKNHFSKMFVALKPCVDGFLNGCRPYLGIDSTVLTGKWRGQLASAIGIDGHNWMFPVAYGVFESESTDNWAWFMDKLHSAIGSPKGLVLSTDAGKVIDTAVTRVFTNGVEHRECMRHLVKNFQKRFSGEVFERNLWPASRAYRQDIFESHYNEMKEACPKATEWIDNFHKHIWTRCQFSTLSKCDYVTNNIAETFNSWIRHEKSLPVVDLMDKIRQMIMERMSVRKRLAVKLTGTILPSVMKSLYARSRDLGYKLYSAHSHLGEIGGTGRDLKTWRHTVDLNTRECSCRQWQVTGIPCTHAIFLVISRRGLELEQFVDDCYSVATFKKAYAGHVVPMTDKSQWAKINVGFKLYPPLLKRSAGRPRSRRIKGMEEGGSGKRKYRCKRCGQFGHIKKTCNEPVADPSAPPPAPPKPKRKRVKKVVLSVQDPVIQVPTATVYVVNSKISFLCHTFAIFTLHIYVDFHFFAGPHLQDHKHLG